MSIYSGSVAQQEYAHGRDLGRDYAEADLAAHAVDADSLRQDATEALRYSVNRRWAAFKLGIARGYRERVRTQNAEGKWGT